MPDNSKIHFLSDPASLRDKERLYLEVRRREGRLLPDEIVRNLPFVSRASPYAREWRWRKRSFARFLSFCKNLPTLRGGPSGMTKKILDLGCGNGWMANRLAENPDWEIWAMDINEDELAQGARLFGRENLRFVYADFPPINRWAEGKIMPDFQKFDIIILAASVQYFPDLKELVFSLKKQLKPDGKIHILDSPFYKNELEQKAARQRTLAYYTKIGVPEMAAFYNHHLWSDVEKLGGENMNDRLSVRFLQKIKWLAPFPWVKL